MADPLTRQPLPLGYQQLTVTTPAVALTVPAGARFAVMRLDVLANTFRYRDDGVDPTAGTGFLVDSTGSFVYAGKLSKFKAIRVSGVDAVLDILYYG